MDGGNRNDMNGIDGDPLKQNQEFLKHHKEIFLDGDVYCGETIERIEKECNCEVICSPHFKGIAFYVENRFHENVQSVVERIHEEERLNEERKVRLAERKDKVAKKIKRRLEEDLSRCESPDDEDLQFIEKCLKTLRMEDYVPEPEARKYRQLQSMYSEYFKLIGWPEDVEGQPAKIYVNSTLLKNY